MYNLFIAVFAFFKMRKKNKIRKSVFLFVIFFAIPLSVFLVSQKTSFFNRAFGKKASLVIDLKNSFDYSYSGWRNLAQGGEEKGRMLLPVINEVKALRPEYIRIDHIYDFYDVVSRGDNSELKFNWSQLDLVINDILSTGAKPFVSLSYMPPVVSKGDIVEIPNNWSEWETIVQKTIEHISGTGGLKISNVYYEVWNEPDLFGNFKVYGDKNYLTLYLHSVKGSYKAKSTLPYKIGGPATTKLYKNWFDSLLKFADQNNLRLDFYSWHIYSKNMNDLEDDWIKAYDWLEKYKKFYDIEFVISEMGPNSKNDPVYDGYFGAIHTIATAAVLDGSVKKSFTFEIKDGPGEEKFWGRWGILTHEKFGTPGKKPRYNALTFLNRMKGKLVNIEGQGSWVKAFGRIDGKILKVLVVNYDPRGKNFESVPMEFKNLPGKIFNFRRTDFSGKVTEAKISSDSDTWQTFQSFKPNTAAIFEIY